MRKLGLHEIRKEYLEFFKEKDHLVAPSFSLVPKNDKSLLLIGAGMAPLKPYFTGDAIPPHNRMVTCQKCIRTGDIENVGRTARHATFFEMLGNFSFGDYFKKEAVAWAWEFLTERLEIDPEDLWVSVYYEDDEAYDIWKNDIGVPEEKIVRLGKEDNFWELEVGPSGPCSEIYIDRGESYGCGEDDCKPGCDCDRFLEVWNLVFTQFDKDDNPDMRGVMGAETIMGAGSLAMRYRELGGVAHYIGKPHQPIFKYCIKLLQEQEVYPGQTVVVGDAMAHDILGASMMQMDTCFVKNGLHARNFQNALDPAAVDKALSMLVAQHNNIRPNYLVETMKWGKPLPDRKHKKRSK